MENNQSPKNTLSKWAVRAALIVMFLGFSYWGLRYSLTKYTALGFSGELCYYVETATSLLDPSLSPEHNFNPFGQNLFGYRGYEATENPLQSIHFEPLKFLYAPIYGLTGRISLLFLFISLLYFSPLLYLAWAAPLKDRAGQVMTLLWGLLYVLYPPTMEVVSFDLRPRAFLVPAIAILLTAALYKRPLWEKILALVFLIAAREEAILIAPFLILVDWLGTPPGKPRRQSALALSALWLTGTIAAFAFFEWSGFERKGSLIQSLSSHWVILLPAGLLFAGLLWWLVKADRFQTPWRLQLAAYLPLLALMGGGGILAYLSAYDQTTFGGLLKYLSSEFLYTARLSTLFAVLFGLAGLLWTAIKPTQRRYGNLALLGLVLISAFGTIRIYPQIHANYGKSGDRVLYPEHAAEIWQLRADTDIITTAVLWDYNTMTAFCDYQNGYGLLRMPYFLVQDEDRLNYPDNLDTLEPLLTDEIEVIAIHRDNRQIVEDLLADLGITPLKVQVSEYGSRYLIYWIK